MKSIFKGFIVRIITWQAKKVLLKYKPHVIAVTGSVGKTSTKDAIYSVMESSFDIRKNQKSFNSEIGTPLTILGCENGWNNPLLWIKNIIKGFFVMFISQPYPKWLVLEIGADRPGDIAGVAKWLVCDMVVITRIPDVPVHVEYFPSPEAVEVEKKALIKALKPDGTLILNADDHRVISAQVGSSHKVISFGIEKTATIKASDITTLYEEGVPKGISFRIDYEGKSMPIEMMGTLGITHVYPALAALACGVTEKMNLIKLSGEIKHHRTPPGRMSLIEGVNGSTIIDDTYNASPVAMTQAVKTLDEIQTSGRKIVVLGDMMEIGKFSVEEHTKIGNLVPAYAQLLVTCGVRSHDIALGASEVGMKDTDIQICKDSLEAGEWLKTKIEKGDIILVKGSQSKRMEKVVEALMANPKKKAGLLVRQEKEWQNR